MKDAMKTMETKILTLLICGLAAMGAITRRIGDSHLVLGFVLPMAIASRRRLGFGQGDESEDNFVYGAFGEENEGGKREPFRYGGRWGGYSNTNLNQVLNWNRWYGSTSGYWLSKDPIGMIGGFNLYAYSLSNPIRYLDSSGFKAMSYEDMKGMVNKPGVNQSGESPNLLLCIAWHESRFDPDQVDPDPKSTAMGLMSVTATMAKDYKVNMTFEFLCDPILNLIAASKGIKHFKQIYGGDLEKALQKGYGGDTPDFGAGVIECAKCLDKHPDCPSCFDSATQHPEKHDRPKIKCPGKGCP